MFRRPKARGVSGQPSKRRLARSTPPSQIPLVFRKAKIPELRERVSLLYDARRRRSESLATPLAETARRSRPIRV